MHMAGAVDVVNGQLRIYLDGALAAVAPRPTNATSVGSGTVDVGVTRSAGVVSSRWGGQIADVAVFGGVPTSSQLNILSAGQDPVNG